ncbi:MAG: DUF2523 domain-containing protein [Zoogloeaceae bacterium]|jgi:hypothetical protein|nr:DUF2523 domain-containing protein [Zoogloeaceae bacterium]
MPLPPVFVSAIIGALLWVISSIVGRVLIALGVTFITYAGLDFTIDHFKGIFLQASSALPGQVIGILGLLKIGTCFNILVSAMAARLVLDGIQSGSVTKMLVGHSLGNNFKP